MQRWITVLGFSMFALFSQFAMALPGDEIWSRVNNGNISSSAAIDPVSGSIYFGSADRSVYAYDAMGNFLWQFKTDGMVGSSPTLNEDGSVLYVGSHDGYVYALSTISGAELWRFATGGIVFASPAVGNTQSGYTVIVGSADNNVYALNASTGAELWNFPTNGDVTTSPVLTQGGMVYVGSSDGFLYALDANVIVGQRLRWQFEAELSGGMFSPIIDKNNYIYVGAFNNTLYSLRTTGPDVNRVRWSAVLNGRIASSPVLASNGALYATTYDDGLLHNVDQATGQVRWSYPTNSQIYSSPAVGLDGTVVFGASDNTIYALDPSLSVYGSPSFLVADLLKWSHTVDAPVVSSPNLDSVGNVYINSTQTFYALEDNSGGPDASGWPMFGADSRHSGRLSATGANVASDDVYLINMDSTPSLAFDVLQNDSGFGISILSVTSSPNSTTDVISAGLGLNYTPNTGFTGLDTFSYSISASSATVTVSVTNAAEDSDLDLMNDAWEIATFGNLSADGSTDVNANGINDLDDYINGLGIVPPPIVNADGDINGDGVIDISDVLAAQRHILDVQLLDSEAIARGDLYPVSGDGQITLSDVLFIQQAILAQTATVTDSDGDLLPDDWEIANGLNPNDATDAILDSDGDGLTNLQERYYGTLPGTIDSDGDGFSDGEEAVLGSDPMDIQNYPVKITSIPITELEIGSTYSYELFSNQANTTYQLVNAPAGAEIIVIVDSAFIQWTPSAEDVGLHDISVIARVNGAPSDTQTYALNIALAGMPGDVNLDGTLTMADNLLAQRHFLNETVLTTQQLAQGDLYPVGAPDGVITISDILLLQQLVLRGE